MTALNQQLRDGGPSQRSLNSTVHSSAPSSGESIALREQGPRLEKHTYEEERPRLGNFTRHAEFFQQAKGTGRRLHTEVATWQLGLRAQTPAFGNRGSGRHWMTTDDPAPLSARGEPPRLPASDPPHSARSVRESRRVWDSHIRKPLKDFTFDMYGGLYKEMRDKNSNDLGVLQQNLPAQDTVGGDSSQTTQRQPGYRAPRTFADSSSFKKTLDPWEPAKHDQVKWWNLRTKGLEKA